MDFVESSTPQEVIPFWFRLFGWFVFAGCASLALQLIYEATFLTWKNGPQILLFSIAHIHGTFLTVGILATLLAYVWLAVFVGLSIYGMLHNLRVSAAAWFQCAVLMCFAFSFCVPYEAWQWLTLEVAGVGPHAAKQMGSAASKNQSYLVKAFLRKGLGVDSTGEDSKTALDMACQADHRDLAQYLIAFGASLDLAQDCRQFPEFASRMKPPALPQALPDNDVPKVPKTTIEVTAPDPRGPYAQSK